MILCSRKISTTSCEAPSIRFSPARARGRDIINSPDIAPPVQAYKKPRRGAFCLTLGPLWSSTCFAEAELLTFNSACIASEESSFLQCGASSRFLLYEGACDTELDCISLCREATSLNVYGYFVRFNTCILCIENGANYLTLCSTFKILLERFVIDDNFFSLRFSKANTSRCSLTTSYPFCVLFC